MEEPKGRKRGKAEIRQALGRRKRAERKRQKSLGRCNQTHRRPKGTNRVEPEAQPSTEDAPIETPDPVEASATPDTTTTTPITPVVESPRRADTMASAFERAEKDREGEKNFTQKKK